MIEQLNVWSPGANYTMTDDLTKISFCMRQCVLRVENPIILLRDVKARLRRLMSRRFCSLKVNEPHFVFWGANCGSLTTLEEQIPEGHQQHCLIEEAAKHQSNVK